MKQLWTYTILGIERTGRRGYLMRPYTYKYALEAGYHASTGVINMKTFRTRSSMRQ